MENPFIKLVKEGEGDLTDDYTELTPSSETLSLEDRQKRIKELKSWRGQVEAGMSMETHPDDAEQLERIDAEIRKLEQQ